MRSCEKSSLRGTQSATKQPTFSRHCEAVAIATTKQSKIKIWIATTCFRKSRNDESIANCHESLCDFCNDNSAHFVFARRFIAEANQTTKTKE